MLNWAVVTVLLRRLTPTKPAFSISRATRLRLTRMPASAYSNVGRLPLSGGCARCVQPPDRRLVDCDHLAHAGGARRPQHGALAAAAERRDPPFGSWLAVYLDRVWQTMSRGRRSPLDGVGRRRLRQRIFQRGAASSIWRLCSMRSAAGSSAGRWRPACTCRWCSTPSTWRSGSGGVSLQDAGRSAHGRLPIHRGLLQSAPAALIARLSVTHRVRTPICSHRSRTRCTRACRRVRACQGAAWKRRSKLHRQRTGRP